MVHTYKILHLFVQSVILTLVWYYHDDMVRIYKVYIFPQFHFLCKNINIFLIDVGKLHFLLTIPSAHCVCRSFAATDTWIWVWSWLQCLQRSVLTCFITGNAAAAILEIYYWKEYITRYACRSDSWTFHLLSYQQCGYSIMQICCQDHMRHNIIVVSTTS